jgi:hypothetical protein
MLITSGTYDVPSAVVYVWQLEIASELRLIFRAPPARLCRAHPMRVVFCSFSGCSFCLVDVFAIFLTSKVKTELRVSLSTPKQRVQ